jgi:hypothetical protein
MPDIVFGRKLPVSNGRSDSRHFGVFFWHAESIAGGHKFRIFGTGLIAEAFLCVSLFYTR